MLHSTRTQKAAWACARSVPALLCLILPCAASLAQRAPASASAPWNAPSVSVPRQETAYSIDLGREYSLADLVDLAEEHNPETRVAWQRAKAAAAALGIARSAFLPALSAFALGESTQQGIILQDGFHIEDLGIWEDRLQLNYTIFDFGQRASQVEVARAKLLSANFGFIRIDKSCSMLAGHTIA